MVALFLVVAPHARVETAEFVWCRCRCASAHDEWILWVALGLIVWLGRR